MKTWLARLGLVLSCSCVAVPTVGCAALLSSLPAISAVVTDAMSVLEVIDAGARDWFRSHPDLGQVQQAYLDAYAKAVNALNAANHVLAGATHITQEQFDAAFAEFRQAFAELRNVLELNGILQGNTLMVGQTPVAIPEPAALTYQVR